MSLRAAMVRWTRSFPRTGGVLNAKRHSIERRIREPAYCVLRNRRFAADRIDLNGDGLRPSRQRDCGGCRLIGLAEFAEDNAIIATERETVGDSDAGELRSTTGLPHDGLIRLVGDGIDNRRGG